MRLHATVFVRLKPGILDPQGKTIEDSLPALGFEGVSGVRVGKTIEFEIEGDDEDSIRRRIESMCESFLANPVIEDYSYVLDPDVLGAESKSTSNSSALRAQRDPTSEPI